MTHTFVLRSSDNALVWVKNPPVKPAFKESIYGQGTYQVLLTQAIRDGVKVADEKEIEHLIFEEHFGGDHGEEIKKDFPYDLDVEMEVRSQMCEKCWGDAYLLMLTNGKSQSENYHNLLEQRKDNPCSPGQLAYLVPKLIPKAKQETLKDWMNKWDDFAVPEFEPKQENDMKEKCEHIYSRSMDQPYPRLCVKCHEPEVKEPKQEGELSLADRIKKVQSAHPNDDSGMLNLLADWFDYYDSTGKNLFAGMIVSEQLPNDQVQRDLRRIAKKLTPAEPKEEQKELTDGEIIKWFRSQKFQTERGEQEYTMIYELDLPKIIRAFIHRK